MLNRNNTLTRLSLSPSWRLAPVLVLAALAALALIAVALSLPASLGF